MTAREGASRVCDLRESTPALSVLAMIKMLSLSFVAVMLGAPCVAQTPGGAAAAVPADSPMVVELFTSQGCPMCPDANVFLAELDSDADVLGLSLSVDIMDVLGWRDTLAHDVMSARQQAYCDALGQRFPYTPQMVIQGARDVRGSRPRAVRQVLERTAKGRAAEGPGAGAPAALEVAWSDDGVHVEVDAPADGVAPATAAADVWLLAYTPGPQTVRVDAGDNAGENVVIHNAVSDVRRLGAWSGAPAAFDVEALSAPAAAVLVQTAGHGPILAARTVRAP